jgi:hypothetical protein
MQNRRRPEDFSSFLKAYQHPYEWAEKAIALRSAAKIAEARAAANRARQW